MHVNNAPGASSFHYPREPEESVGQRSCPGCSGSPWDVTPVCVCSQCWAHTAQLCTQHTQHSRGAPGPAHCWGSCCPWKAGCQPDPPRQLLVLPRVPLVLQFCAYTPKLHIQCTECLFMLNKWDASCLHTCTNSLTYIAHLCLLCDCPRKHQSKEGDTEHNLPPKHRDIK